MSYGTTVHECTPGSYCCWMSNLEEMGIGNQNLLNIIIPGSHDSATSNINETKEYASNAPPILLKAKKFYTGTKLKNLVVRWAIAQERNVFQQLCDGIRYIDLRVCSVKNPGDKVGTMYTCHSVISDKLEDVLNDIKEFTEKHPKEILIIDFNHFYDMDAPTHKSLVNMIETKYSSRLIKKEMSLTSKIENYWKEGKSIIVLYDKTTVANEYDFLWPQVHIYSAWMNSPTLEDLKEKLYNHMQFRNALITGKISDKKYDFRNIFHVCQGIVTPDTKMIVGSVISRRKFESLIQLGKVVTPAFIQWFSEEWADVDFNILLVDHYHLTNFVEVTYMLNQKKLLQIKNSS